MHLPRIRSRGIAALPVKVLHGNAAVGIALHAQAREQTDKRLRLFGEAVMGAGRNCNDAGQDGSSLLHAGNTLHTPQDRERQDALLAMLCFA